MDNYNTKTTKAQISNILQTISIFEQWNIVVGNNDLSNEYANISLAFNSNRKLFILWLKRGNY